jgi:hypothetical protein
VDDARAEVTDRVDGVPRRATQREADADHDESHEEHADAGELDAVGQALGEDRDDEHEGADDLRHHVLNGVADLG